MCHLFRTMDALGHEVYGFHSKMKHLQKKLQHLNYVVQRNWEGEEGHDDLDLLVWGRDEKELREIVDDDPLVDIRTEKDGYYPKKLAILMLTRREQENGWWVPNKHAHFLSLYYHNEVHKEGNPYAHKLRELLLELYPPTEPDDKGVEFHI